MNTWLLHAVAGYLIGKAALIFFPLWVAVLAVVLAAVGKELWDKYDGGVFDWLDLLFTVIGGWIAFGEYIKSLI
jgi:hypothetical protein